MPTIVKIHDVLFFLAVMLTSLNINFRPRCEYFNLILREVKEMIEETVLIKQRHHYQKYHTNEFGGLLYCLHII